MFCRFHRFRFDQESTFETTGTSIITSDGHTFEHELAVAVDNGMLGSIDANRGDYQNGWDTDQFPITVSVSTSY